MSTTECPLCTSRFNRNEKEPKILDCGHTFCKECMSDMMKKNNNVIICPICINENKKINDVSDLTTNRSVLDFLYNPLNKTTQSSCIIKPEENTYRYKIILIGKSYSGKTSLIQRYIKGTFNPDNIQTTVGREYSKKELNINDKKLILDIWDTAGLEKYQSIAFNYYRNCYGAIIVFDITSKDSFIDADNWLKIYKEHCNNENISSIILVGNKLDLDGERKVSKEEAENYAKKNGLTYFETSVLKDINVKEMFKFLAKKLLDNYKNIKKNNEGLKLSNTKKDEKKWYWLC